MKFYRYPSAYREPMKVTAMFVHEPDAEKLQAVVFAPIAFVLFFTAIVTVTCVLPLLLAAAYFLLA